MQNLPDDIEDLLKSLYKMSQTEDWDESSAQELVVWGGTIYEKYYLPDNGIIKEDRFI